MTSERAVPVSLIDDLEAKADELDRMDARGQIWGLEEVSDLLRRAAKDIAAWNRRAAPPAAGEGELVPVDALAQEIRRVDGNNSLGAGALAEALMPFLSARLSADLEEARGLLEPFAEYGRHIDDGETFSADSEIVSVICSDGLRRSIRFRHLRAARAFLTRTEPRHG